MLLDGGDNIWIGGALISIAFLADTCSLARLPPPMLSMTRARPRYVLRSEGQGLAQAVEQLSREALP
eukprot:6481708-Amphidinium_carterae.1